MKANFLMLIATFIWGTAFVSQTTGMGAIGPFTFSFARFFLASLTVLPLLLIYEKKNNEILNKYKSKWTIKFFHEYIDNNNMNSKTKCCNKKKTI